MSYYAQKIGYFGEKLAQNYLKRKGYKIIEANVKTSYKEIDIIARQKDMLVFVEVKTRTSQSFGKANEGIGYYKLQNLKKAITYYLSRNDKFNQNFRLDLIAIDINRYTKTAYLKHYKEII